MNLFLCQKKWTYMIQRGPRDELWAQTAFTFFIMCDWNVESTACDGPFPLAEEKKAREIVKMDWPKVKAIVLHFANIDSKTFDSEPLEKLQRR